MSFKETTDSGQPKNVYYHPKDLADLIYRKLGVGEGFVSFQHKLQFLEVIIDLIQILREAERQGMCINEFTNKPISQTIDPDAFEKFMLVWEVGGWLLTTYYDRGDGVFEREDEYFFEYPTNVNKKTQYVQVIPSLFAMKSKDELSSEKYLLRIGQGVLERDAYKNEDPETLCQNGHLEKERDGVLVPFFQTYQDIEMSIHYTKDVPRNYYDTMTSIAYRKIKVYADIIRVNCWKMAKQMEDFDAMKTMEKPQRRISMEKAKA